MLAFRDVDQIIFFMQRDQLPVQREPQHKQSEQGLKDDIRCEVHKFTAPLPLKYAITGPLKTQCATPAAAGILALNSFSEGICEASHPPPSALINWTLANIRCARKFTAAS